MLKNLVDINASDAGMNSDLRAGIDSVPVGRDLSRHASAWFKAVNVERIPTCGSGFNSTFQSFVHCAETSE